MTTFSPICDVKSFQVAFFNSKWKDMYALTSYLVYIVDNTRNGTLTNDRVDRVRGNEQIGIWQQAAISQKISA